MLEPWNDSSILFPAILTYPCDSSTDVNVLKYTCEKIINVLSKQSPLHKESALFSRFLYKVDKKFRNDIGYRHFKKVNTALRKYLVLNLLKNIEYFVSNLPSNDDDLFLPSRQMLEYVLVRLITFSKIMMRICLCSKKAAIFFLHRLKRGESHWMCLMPYALLSRVWSICKVLLQHSCGWYAHLYSILDKLQLKGLNFLPNGYKLPIDLEEWLHIKYLDDCNIFQWSQKKFTVVDKYFVEDEDEDEDTLDTILKFVKQINSEDSQETEVELKQISNNSQKVTPIQISAIKSIDHGEVISRESYKKIPSVLPSISLNKDNIRETQQDSYITQSIECGIRRKDNSNHSFESITNKKLLKEFIEREEIMRNENSRHSLTSHLSFLQWQVLKNSLLKLCQSFSKNKKIERQMKNIWKEKCLDYS